MAGLVRVGIDNSAGHCYNPRPADIAGQDSVFVNGSLVVVKGGHYPNHTCGTSTHDGVAQAGSGTVFICGQPAHRIGDPISCGDVAAGSSSDTFSGG